MVRPIPLNSRFTRERETTPPTNWRRGLFRLWVLISSAWIMAWFIFYAIEAIGGEWTAKNFLVVPVVLFGPPVALLVFGVATRWAFRGFES